MKKSIILFNAFCLVILLSCAVEQSFAQNWYSVRWVDDGDTIVLMDGRRVRYIGINAPEIDHKDKKAEPCGYSTKNYNKNVVLSKKVRLEFDKGKHDQYGRLLAYVFLEDGTFVNEVMIKQGHAYCLYRDPNRKYNKKLLRAQRDAMIVKMGIWKNWK
ncbi:MAG: thermonuclease family protein, partial [Proteobacteria bacterium]|nr:thermonuclease family protein [Pseudomonadota bacterium]